MATLMVVYKLNCPPPTEMVRLFESDTRVIEISHQEVRVESAKMDVGYTEGGSVWTMVPMRHGLPLGTYLLIWVLIPGPLPEHRVRASMEAAAVAAIFEAAEPRLLAEKCLEVVPKEPSVTSMSPEGSLVLTSRPPTPVDSLVEVLGESLGHLDGMGEEERARFSLCSRWFMRALATVNEADRFLSFFIALEVFPAMGTSDVVGAVRDFLHKEFFPEIEPGEIKVRLELGRIAGLRAQIVHDGLANLEDAKQEVAGELLKKLEAVTRVVVRHAGSLGYGGTLDQWLHTD